MDDRQIETFRVARKFRKLLGHLNTIEWHQFMHYDQIWLMHRPTHDGLPSFGQFRKELKDAIGYLPQGSRLIRAFEELSVNTESEWAPAKATAWSRFHEFCDYVGILRDHTAKPVLDSTPSVVIVPANRVADFDFSLCCDVEFEAFPEGSASLYECMRRGTCGTCGMPLTVSAIDAAVLNRVYRKCIVKARRIAEMPANEAVNELPLSDSESNLLRKLAESPKKWHWESELLADVANSALSVLVAAEYLERNGVHEILGTENDSDSWRAMYKPDGSMGWFDENGVEVKDTEQSALRTGYGYRITLPGIAAIRRHDKIASEKHGEPIDTRGDQATPQPGLTKEEHEAFEVWCCEVINGEAHKEVSPKVVVAFLNWTQLLNDPTFGITPINSPEFRRSRAGKISNLSLRKIAATAGIDWADAFNRPLPDLIREAKQKVAERRAKPPSDDVMRLGDSESDAFRYGDNWMTENFAKDRFGFTHGQVSKAAREKKGLRGVKVTRRKAMTQEGRSPEYVYHAGEVQILRNKLDEIAGE
jgi:hypothetical protein